MRDEPALLKIAEAADLLRVSRSQAYTLARRAEIPTVRVGSALRVPRERLQEWIDRRVTGGEAVR
jgi:excisionase family DNA binding protein